MITLRNLLLPTKPLMALPLLALNSLKKRMPMPMLQKT